MELVSLGYVGVRTRQPEAWGTLATRLLGMQAIDRGGPVTAFRMDDRFQRLVVLDEPGSALAFLGWEARDAQAMARLAARLEAAGIAVHRGTGSLAAERHVAGLIRFQDPAGNWLEVFHGPAAADRPFVPGRPISGFRTGPLGMGHAVLQVEQVEALLPFYRDLLGFRVSDYGLQPYPLYFFHLAGGRHHSFAMVGSGRHGFHHLMVELGSLDDVGQGYDLAGLEEGRLAYTLGRHTNDYMTSFYANTPSGFFVEYGWGGLVLDPSAWTPHMTVDGPSLWGHERLHLPPEPRARLREMRLAAAARGVRAPVECAWLARQPRQTPP
ncbi:biphenyl 2,3-dioxygenase [Roseicella aquatilis]|uniref:Biphenyl 2,3-dioxygenase n=1 Tax=Roseicella aquatilis TaxID=2527868 RepID=A0A4R4D5X1_9PROT|nr:biphenyl 2,3-dioxygenase [Roseicella aquatilis]